MNNQSKNTQKGSSTWVKGMKSPNPNGRPKGSKNRFNKEFKEQLRKTIGKYIKNLDADFDALSSNERVKAIALLAKFVAAEKQEVKGKIKGDFKIDVSYSDEVQQDNSDEPTQD